MRTILNIFLGAFMTSSALAYDPSRKGQDIKYVYMISAQGSHSPKKAMGYASNQDEEPKQLDTLTPFGIRQQYMIGNELRERYINDLDEAFMPKMYNVTQTYLQTSWNSTTVLSSQAMMMGFYPPGQNDYKITDEQKYSAVPPLNNDFDFKPWIDEMGDSALPNGAMIYPIQMNQWAHDTMLAIDSTNCKAIQDDKSNPAKQQSLVNEATGAKMGAFIQSNGGFYQVCGYVNWAYIEQIVVNSQFETDFGCDLNDAYTKCQAAGEKINQYNHEQDGNQNYITTNDLRQNLQRRLVTWINEDLLAQGKTVPSEIADEAALIEKNKLLYTTTGSEAPQFVLLHVTEEYLSLLASYFFNHLSLQDQSLPASSQIVIELERVNGALNVKGFVNDVEYKFIECATQATCTADYLQTGLKSGIEVTDVATSCASGTIKDKRQFDL